MKVDRRLGAITSDRSRLQDQHPEQALATVVSSLVDARPIGSQPPDVPRVNTPAENISEVSRILDPADLPGDFWEAFLAWGGQSPRRAPACRVARCLQLWLRGVDV